MWKLFQGAIIFAVGASNIHWHWTPNLYLAVMVGVCWAWIATELINDIQIEIWKWKARRPPPLPKEYR
jgi:hypothetical protein